VKVKSGVKTTWHCADCGHKQLRWTGQCPLCSAWNTFQEESEEIHSDARKIPLAKTAAKPMSLKEIAGKEFPRMLTGLAEVDRALGGGLVAGSLSLLGGEPGIGKSTLSLQLAHQLASQNIPVFYVCAEESLEQTALRAQRLAISTDNILFFNETDVARILSEIEQHTPKFLIIDSIQIVYKPEVPSAPGSVSQIRETAQTFMQLAKTCDIATLLIGHVTKSGDIAGPKVLEHLVDTVLYFEGDKQQNFRLLRVNKNRFGPTDEIAIFQMKGHGLEQVSSPSELFLEERMRGSIGSVIIPTLEGTRPILIEVQALVTDTFFANPSRRSTGIDQNRLALLLAVLEKRAKLHLHKCDIFASVTGGIRIAEPACDLGILLAISSSFSSKAFHPDTIVIGEVGLGGEIRGVPRIESRIKEGIQLGFLRAIVPKHNLKGISESFKKKITIMPVSWIEEAIE
jgi:DNA repair protein RadA/Sms